VGWWGIAAQLHPFGVHRLEPFEHVADVEGDGDRPSPLTTAANSSAPEPPASWASARSGRAAGGPESLLIFTNVVVLIGEHGHPLQGGMKPRTTNFQAAAEAGGDQLAVLG